MPLPRHDEPRGVVRIAKLERALEAFNQEQGVKVAQSLAEYHQQFVEPRLAELERRTTPRTVRLLRWIRAQIELRRALAPTEQEPGD